MHTTCTLRSPRQPCQVHAGAVLAAYEARTSYTVHKARIVWRVSISHARPESTLRSPHVGGMYRVPRSARASFYLCAPMLAQRLNVGRNSGRID